MMKKIFSILAFFLVLAVGITPAIAAEMIGLIISVEGSATAIDEAGGVRTLANQSKVFLNDTIVTGEKAKLQVVFTDDTIFSQGENSEMKIDQYAYNPNVKDENEFGVKLKSGIFRTITGNIPRINEDRFEVQTSRTTIGIRGCELGFETGTAEDRVLVFTVPAGKKIFVSPKKGNQKKTLTNPCSVTIGDDGNVNVGPLAGGDRAQSQRATTPKGGFGGGGEQGGGEQGGGAQEQGGGNADSQEFGGGDPNPFDPGASDKPGGGGDTTDATPI